MNKYHNIKKVVNITDPTWNHMDDMGLHNIVVNYDKLNTPGYIFLKDKHSIYRWCNQNAIELYGVDSLEGIIGKADYDFNQKYADDFIKQDQYVMSTGLNHISERDIITLKDGTNKILRTEKNHYIIKINIELVF